MGPMKKMRQAWRSLVNTWWPPYPPETAAAKPKTNVEKERAELRQSYQAKWSEKDQRFYYGEEARQLRLQEQDHAQSVQQAT